MKRKKSKTQTIHTPTEAILESISDVNRIPISISTAVLRDADGCVIGGAAD